MTEKGQVLDRERPAKYPKKQHKKQQLWGKYGGR